MQHSSWLTLKKNYIPYTKLEQEFDLDFKQYVQENFKRFLDDCFILLTRSKHDLEKLHQILNDLHPSIHKQIMPSFSGYNVDGVSPSVFRCTSTPMETGPIGTCVETNQSGFEEVEFTNTPTGQLTFYQLPRIYLMTYQTPVKAVRRFQITSCLMSRVHVTVEITFLRTFKMANLCSQTQFQGISDFLL